MKNGKPEEKKLKSTPGKVQKPTPGKVDSFSFEVLKAKSGQTFAHGE